MNFCKRSYQLILRYLYTETVKRGGEISLHKHFKDKITEIKEIPCKIATAVNLACTAIFIKLTFLVES